MEATQIRTQESNSRFVETTVNYSVQSDYRPIINNEDYSQNKLSLKPARIKVRDADSEPNFSSSLEVEGFVCIDDHYENVEDLAREPSDEESVAYRQHMAEMIKSLSGADEVISPVEVVRRQKANTTAGFVHSDQSPAGPEQLSWALSEPTRTPSRIALYNIWRLLTPGPTNCPLALCDASSVTESDIIIGDSVFPTTGMKFETLFLKENPSHRWTYFSKLTPNRIIIFKQVETVPDWPYVVPHTAFEDKSCPPGAAPRVSIESRVLARWYD